MKLESVVLLCFGFWAYTDAQCTTPLGSRSQCLSLYDCEPLLTAFQARPLQPNVITYLRRSSCGFQGNIPKVCCGPVPQDSTPTPSRPPQNNRPTGSNGRPALSVSEDSAPSPKGQCGKDSNADRILGGELTDLDEFPWMALLGYRTSRGGLTYQCGGALINRRYVLTAAHCVVGEIETKVGRLATVRLGEYDTDTEQDCLDGTCADPAQEYDVARAIANPGFRDGQANRQDDIAIVRMAQRANFNFYVRPICLPDGNSPRLGIGSEVYVAGWGKTLDGKPSNVKLKLSLPIYSKPECSQKYARLGANLIDRQLCAGGGFAKDACRGDSGGPLMRFVSSPGYWEQIGVVSFGNGCGREDWPGIYTSVAHYRDWIISTMRETNN